MRPSRQHSPTRSTRGTESRPSPGRKVGASASRRYPQPTGLITGGARLEWGEGGDAA